MVYPFDKRYGISSSFQGHLNRTPPSKMPGTDYLTPVGQPVYAPWDGWAQQEDPKTMKGAVAISITRNQPGQPGDKIYFIHLSKVVDVGRDVKAGDLIGYTGNTGNTTGPHTCIPYRPIWNKNSYVDVAPILAGLSLKGESQSIQPSLPDNKLIQELQTQLKNTQESLQAEVDSNKLKQVDLQLKITQATKDIEELSRQNGLLQVYADMYNLKLDNLAESVGAEVVEEVISRTGLMVSYGNLVDRLVKSDKLRGFLKYDVFVLIYSALSLVLAVGVKPYIEQTFKVIVPDWVAIGLAIGIGSYLKNTQTKYDTNKDGRITAEDLKFFAATT